MKGFCRTLALVLGVSACPAAADVLQPDWTVRFVAGPGPAAPTQPLRLRLSPRIPVEARAVLRFSLDGVDVTPGFVLRADEASYLPRQPLGDGSHRLRLLYAPPAGRWRELGVWDFTVAAAAKAAGRPVAERYAVATSLGGAGELELQLAPASAAEASSAALAEPQAVRPGEVLATVRAGDLSTRVGRQKLAYESLIHKDRERQGAATVWDLGGHTRLTGFGLQSADHGGYQRLLGADRARNSLNGALLRQQWSLAGKDRLGLAAGWVFGSARPELADSDAQHDGNAWSLAGDAGLLADRLRLRAEYAGSHFEWARAADTDDTGAAALSPRDTGQAYAMSAEFTSAEPAKPGWRLGMAYSLIDPWFGSLANPTLDADRQRLRTFAGLGLGDWQLDLSLERQRNNLAGDPTVTTVHKRKARLVAAWSPARAPEFGFLGRPNLRLTADIGRTRQHTPGAVVPDACGLRAAQLQLRTEFAHSGWRWGVDAKRGETLDTVAAGQGAAPLALNLYGDFTAAGPVPVKPSLSWHRTPASEGAPRTESWLARLRTAAFALRRDLAAKLDLGYLRRDTSVTATDGASAVQLDGSLLWTLQRPRASGSGLTLTVTGSYRDGAPDLAAVAGADDYRLMLSLSTGTPPTAW